MIYVRTKIFPYVDDYFTSKAVAKKSPLYEAKGIVKRLKFSDLKTSIVLFDVIDTTVIME